MYICASPYLRPGLHVVVQFRHPAGLVHLLLRLAEVAVVQVVEDRVVE